MQEYHDDGEWVLRELKTLVSMCLHAGSSNLTYDQKLAGMLASDNYVAVERFIRRADEHWV